MKIGILQYDVQWLNVEANFDNIRSLLETNTNNCEVIFLPEMFNTGYLMSPSSTIKKADNSLARLQELSILYNTVFVGSIPYLSDGKYTNRMCIVDQDGLIDYYDKIHLFTPAGEAKEYVAGQQIKDVRIGDILIRPLVCYDLRFPYASYNRTNYDLAAFSANWPTARIDQWKALLAARAIENQSYCIGVNRIGQDSNGYQYNGHSRIIDYMGNTILDCRDEEGLFTADLDIKAMYNYRKKLPFLNDQKAINID